MEILGPETKQFDGPGGVKIECQLIDDFDTRADAEYWKGEAIKDGYDAHVRANAAKRKYELWVSVMQVRQGTQPVAPQV